MLQQQTRVEAARGYFERFLERFPPSNEAGGGDHRRGPGRLVGARLLPAGAAAARRGTGGRLPRRFPERAAELEEPPGIGPCTVAARSPARLRRGRPGARRQRGARSGRGSSPKSAAWGGRSAGVLAAAAELPSPGDPGDSNQALMELGATVCLPVRPRCPDCPLATVCAAFRAGRPELYPVKAARRPPTLRCASSRRWSSTESACCWSAGERRGSSLGLGAAAGRGGVRGRRAPARCAPRRRVDAGAGRWAGPPRHHHPGPHGGGAPGGGRSAPGEGARERLAGAEGGWFPLAEARRLALTGVARKIVEKFAPEALRGRDG
ncbi:MAG: hypothetical protein R2862_01895 [Thermoanaerobaculia bacterium]